MRGQDRREICHSTVFHAHIFTSESCDHIAFSKLSYNCFWGTAVECPVPAGGLQAWKASGGWRWGG